MLNRSDKIRLVTKLHKLTLDGKLQWEYESPPDVSQDKFISSEMYAANLSGIRFTVHRISGYRYPARKPDHLGSIGHLIPETQRFTDRYVLDVYDAENGWNTDSITDFEGVNPVRDLLAAIRSKMTNVDAKLKALIEEPADESLSLKM